MGYLSRQPGSNDPPKPTTKWGSQSEVYDDFACLLGGQAKRCATCRCVVLTKWQRQTEEGTLCPDCTDALTASKLPTSSSAPATPEPSDKAQ